MIYTVLNYNFVQLTFQILLSESVFLIGRQKREHFLPKLAGAIVLNFVLAFAWQSLIGYLVGTQLAWYVLLYVGYACISALVMTMCFEITPLEMVFIMAGGYGTQHMTFALSRIVLYYLHIPYATYGDWPHLLITRYAIFFIGTACVYFLIIRNNRDKNGFGAGDIRIAALAVVLMLAATGLSVYWSYPNDYVGTLVGEVICPAYSFLCCALVLLMEYYVLRENGMKREHEMMEQLIQISNTQQKSTQEAIDIINIKCHDLKHQIKALAQMDDAQSRSEYLQEVQEAVSIYDATYHTGSKAMDYVLREKSLLFDERKVEFSCMVEGKIIGFMAPVDIYAMMGNALDNALEQVLTEAEDERIISLQIKKHGEMVLIHLENRCSRELEFVDGLPVTTKKDKSQHGFGVKSIRYIAEKYDGYISMGTKAGSFYLDILIPMEA
ncbi:MAG: ATP-binding protein [Lachnospiraceae bacterium]|nr:ATP-binding protein [Lachnospiraceae bacterium]MDD3615203.1 ATP-binding protein [Lachnospiraceae bacterium]